MRSTVNRKRTFVLVAVIAVAVALGALYLFWPTTSEDTEPETPDPTASDPTPSDPEPSPSESEPEDEVPPESGWSTPITPACGDVLTESDLDAALEFDAPPQQVSPEDSFPVTVRNTSDSRIVAELDRYDFAVPVLTDEDGTVTAMGDLDPVLAEGHSVLVIDPGDEIGASGTLRWTMVCGEEPGEAEPAAIPEGEYQMFLLARTGPFDDPENAEQVQGGPFAVTVDAGAEHDVPVVVPDGAAALPECGQEWALPSDVPGELVTSAGESLDPTDGLTLTGELTLPTATSGASLYAHIVIVDDGTVIGPRPPASDNLLGWYASAGATAEVTAVTDAETCEGQPLPPGDYEAFLVVSTIGEEGPTLAVSSPVPFDVSD